MIRKSILILCILGTIASGVVCVASYNQKRTFVFRRGPSTSVELIIADGQVLLVEIRTAGHFISTTAGVSSRTAVTLRKSLFRFPIYLMICGLMAPWCLYGFYRYVLNPTRRHRLRDNLCLNCGYSLFGLPEPRCPECNKAFDPSSLSQEWA